MKIKIMKNKIIILLMFSSFCIGVFCTTFMKKKEVVYIKTAYCEGGTCLSNHNSYSIGEDLNDIKLYIKKIKSKDNTQNWMQNIENDINNIYNLLNN
tara:strand:+ start:2634 stop:2924 length:291 start_codon:yes stop_codon:yes gene_type:complete